MGRTIVRRGWALGLGVVLAIAFQVTPAAQPFATQVQIAVTRLTTGVTPFTDLGVVASGYINFGAGRGTTGYGVRDLAGTIQFKNSGGSWAAPLSGITGGTCANQFVRSISTAGLPTCSTVSLTADVTGLLPVANGGTGANLSATGGTNQVVRQNSSGAAFTVSTLASTDLSDTANIAYQTGSYANPSWITSLATTKLTGTLQAAQFPALSGNVTTSAGSLATTIAAGVVTNAMLAGGIDLATKVTGILLAADFPALLGDITTSAGSVTTAIGPSKVTNTMLAGSIAASKLVGTDITTVGTVTTGTWSGLFGAVSGANLTTLNASNLSSGTVPDARFPATLPAASGVNLTALNATQLTSGTVPDARFPATLPAASGVNLTALNATNLASGTVADGRLSSNVPLKNGTNAWTGTEDFQNTVTFSALTASTCARFNGSKQLVSAASDCSVGTYFATTTPTIASGFGSSPSISGRASSFTITVGTGTSSAGTVDFNTTFTTAPPCVATYDHIIGEGLVTLDAESTTTQVIISLGTPSSTSGGSKIHVICLSKD